MPRVVDELRAGAKASHWMWFVFPQLQALGRSATARRFGITSREQAAAYVGDAVLGVRLRECTALVVAVKGRSALQIFGHPDDMKFRSSMTLFAAVAPQEPVFAQALAQYFGGEGDALTLALLAQMR